MGRGRQGMRVVLVCGTKPHHKFWAWSLWRRYDVVGIVHPSPKNHRVEDHPFSHRLLQKLSHPYQLLPFSKTSALEEEERRCFGDYRKRYDEISREVIHHLDSINSAEGIETIKKLRPDVICLMGGEIASRRFLESTEAAVLGYHSGLSPFYNGTDPIPWALVEHNVRLIGGALMYLTPQIDRGPILGHYLPSIEESDTHASLFMKTIKGGLVLYERALDALSEGKRPDAVSQPAPIRYTRSMDWTIMEDLSLSFGGWRRKMTSASREEQVLWYDALGLSGEEMASALRGAA